MPQGPRDPHDPPARATQVDRGSTVTLVVSSGPQQVDGARRRRPATLDDARRRARATRASRSTVTEQESTDDGPGTVLAQSPGRRHEAAKGSTVTLTVAKEPPTVDGARRHRARRRHDAIGRAARRRLQGRTSATQDVDDPDEDGIVLAQDPAGGEGQAGPTVTITVGRFTRPAGDDTDDPTRADADASEGRRPQRRALVRARRLAGIGAVGRAPACARRATRSSRSSIERDGALALATARSWRCAPARGLLERRRRVPGPARPVRRGRHGPGPARDARRALRRRGRARLARCAWTRSCSRT